MDTSLGIDVGGIKKGYHAVILNKTRAIVHKARLPTPETISALIDQFDPTVVAIDAPCGWSSGKSRRAERALAARGVSSFCTPTRAKAARSQFYRWMFQGERAYAAAVRHRRLFRGGRTLRGCTIEVFPNATVVALRGGRKPRSISKVVWRRETLARAGISTASLCNIDLVDAALCALTGLFALAGQFECFGESTDGVLVAPVGIPALRKT